MTATLERQQSSEEKWQAARQRIAEGYRIWLEENSSTAGLSSARMESNKHADLPIALRKAKRKSNVSLSPTKPRTVSDSALDHTATPSTQRSKRVRFSDPTQFPTLTGSTSLTPALRRSSLGTPHRRRFPSPTRTDDVDHLQFTPFRQALDERCKRRIRRNGLSEEMNSYEAEKKTKLDLQIEINAKDSELKRLREELEQFKNGLVEPDNVSKAVPTSQEQVDVVEAELEALRQSFALEESDPVPSWNHVPIGTLGPGSEGGDTIRIYEDEDGSPARRNDFQNDTDCLAMGLELEAAKQVKRSLLDSFRENGSFSSNLDFADSPVRPQSRSVSRVPDTPTSFYHDLSKQLKANTKRAEDAELALTVLENEVKSLGFGGDQLNAVEIVTEVAKYFREARLNLERLVPGETIVGFENNKVLPELLSKLKLLAQQLQSKEVQLTNAKQYHHNLKGNFEKAIIAAEKANARIKDLEASLDGNAEEMLHMRIRAQGLEKDVIEKDKDIQSLTSALDKYREDVRRLEQLITDVENDQICKATSLAAQVALEHEQEISDLCAKVSAEERGRRAAEHSAVSRLGKIHELETTLAATKRHAADLEDTLSTLQTQLITSSQSSAQEVGALNSRISSLATALANANAENEKLKVTKLRLEERVRMEVEQGAEAVDRLQTELIRAVTKTNETKKSYVRGAKVRIANWEIEESSDGMEDLNGPMTPASLVRFAEFAEVEDRGSDQEDIISDLERTVSNVVDDDDHVPGTVAMSRGKKYRSIIMKPRAAPNVVLKNGKGRRRYDSGIGMSPILSDGESRRRGSGFMTPDLSSEADADVESEINDVMTA